MSYTYAVLEVSASAYREIRRLLLEAGHGQAIHADPDPREPEVIDMHGIALRASATPAPGPRPLDFTADPKLAPRLRKKT